MIKHHDQTLSKEDLVYLSYTCRTIQHQSQESPSGQETGGRTDAEALDGYCLLVCFPWLAQPAFL